MKLKSKWVFLGRDSHGWLGFRCVEGPGSVFTNHWAGDLYISPDAYWNGDWCAARD